MDWFVRSEPLKTFEKTTRKMSTLIANLTPSGTKLYKTISKDGPVHLYASFPRGVNPLCAADDVSNYLRTLRITSFRISIHFGTCARHKSPISVRLGYISDFDLLIPLMDPVIPSTPMDPIMPSTSNGRWADDDEDLN
jgi:hypothetical protein